MRFLLDENADARLGTYLRSVGHDVVSIVRDFPRALPDEEVLALARRERRILITNDRDFGDLVFRHGRPHAGVIYLRLESVALSVLVTRFADLLARYSDQLDHFVVVSERSIRVRRG